jgi:hypothetical protein
VVSQRQLPTDHDYVVSTREYQLDQSSPLPASAAADPVLVRKKRPAHLDRSLHITSDLPTNHSERRVGEQAAREFVVPVCAGQAVDATAKSQTALSLGE